MELEQIVTQLNNQELNMHRRILALSCCLLVKYDPQIILHKYLEEYLCYVTSILIKYDGLSYIISIEIDDDLRSCVYELLNAEGILLKSEQYIDIQPNILNIVSYIIQFLKVNIFLDL